MFETDYFGESAYLWCWVDTKRLDVNDVLELSKEQLEAKLKHLLDT